MNSDASKNVLYVGTSLDAVSIGGREQLSQLIRSSLRAIGVGQIEIVDLPRTKVPATRAPLAILRGHVDGVSSSIIGRIMATIDSRAINTVVLDGSNLGSVAKAVQFARPEVQVITFFHNCEARFFLGAARQRPSVRALGVLLANYLAERSAVRYSDKRICLNERDSEQLRRLYGRGATHISAMAVRDKLPASSHAANTPPVEPYALFVGGAFYANQSGIAWFARNVAPYVTMKTCVVGRGLEAERAALEGFSNIEVVGEVEDLAPWYRNAHLVVAPIFDGSGMKTKVAEALMFGKRIIGTPEAFSGYEDIAAQAGEICADAAGFIAAIEREATRPFVAVDSQLRAVYEARYSFGAASSRLRDILGASVHEGGR